MSDETALLKVPADQYGPAYREHMLEQYKLYVEMANQISERRVSTHNYFLTVNSGLVTLYGLASALSSDTSRNWRYLVPAAGILVCVSWLVLIRSYRELNSAKFRVIHEIEQHLPVAGYAREWSLLDRGQGRRYMPLTHVEPYIPWVFLALYVLLAVFTPR